MNKEYKYKGKTIEVKFPSGMFEYYSDKEGRFLKFDTLKGAKESINKEGKSIDESIKSKTQKIKLSELRQLVKKCLNENKENDDFIVISNTSRSHIKQINSKSNFFNSEIIYNVTDDEIIFEKPTLDYGKKTVTPQKKKSGWWGFQIVAENISEGKYYFDEDSTEDQIIIYYE